MKSILIAAVVGLIVSILFTPYLIRVFARRGLGQEIRDPAARGGRYAHV